MTGPVRLGADVWLVGSGHLGLELTSPWDAHVWLCHTSAGWVVVDAGCGLATGAIASHVAAATGDQRVRAVLLTHAHADHAAGAGALADELGCEAYALPAAAAIVRAGDEDAAGLADARAAGVYPPGVVLGPAPVRELAAGDAFGLQVVPTDGHAAGHAAFVLRGPDATQAFTGDLVFARGRVAVLDTADTDRAAYAASLRALLALAPDRLWPGHAEPVLSRGTEHVSAALDAFISPDGPRNLT